MTDPAPLDLRQCEKDLHAMTGSAASDAVTRSTVGLKLLAELRAARGALQEAVENEEGEHAPLKTFTAKAWRAVLQRVWDEA
jgi:hypothetical protein